MNHLSPLLNHLKKNVSRDRTRFDDDRFDLDLTYITDNIIAMAFPASGIEAVWRNHIDDVAEMLKTYHEGHYKIWNLSERTYDYSKFDNQTVDFGFPDHHSPPLKTLFEIVWSMYEYLKSDKHHIAAVHCMGGKGRTGTVICAYLIFTNRFQTPDESFAYFAAKRSAIEKGVTQPSQKRYVRYFSQIIQNQIFPKPKVLVINKIMLVSVPGLCKGKTGCNPVCRVYAQTFLPKVQLFSSSPKGQPAKFVSRADGSIVWKVDVMVQGDILIKGKHAGKHRSRRLFRFAFHTAFVNDTYVELKPEDLDDWRALTENDKEHQKEKAKKNGEDSSSPRAPPVMDDADKNFSLILYFTEPQREDADMYIGANKQEQAMSAHYEGVLTSMFEAKKTMKPYAPEPVEFKNNPIHRDDQGTFAASRLYQEPPARNSSEAAEQADQAKTMLREYYERQLPQAQGSGINARERLASLRQKRQEFKEANGLLTRENSGSAKNLFEKEESTSPRAVSPRPTPYSSTPPPVPPLALASSPRSPRSALSDAGVEPRSPDNGSTSPRKMSPRKSPRKASEPVPVTPWIHTSARLREEMGSSKQQLYRSPSEMSALKAAAAEARARAQTQATAPVSARELNPLVGTITLESGEEAEISIDCILGPRSTVRAQALAQVDQQVRQAPSGTSPTAAAPSSPAPAPAPSSFVPPLTSPGSGQRKATVGAYRQASVYSSSPTASPVATSQPTRPSPSGPTPLSLSSGNSTSSPSPPFQRASPSPTSSSSPAPPFGLPPPTDLLPPPDLPPPPPPEPAPASTPVPAPAPADAKPAAQRSTTALSRSTTRASRRPMLYEASEVQTLSTNLGAPAKRPEG